MIPEVVECGGIFSQGPTRWLGEVSQVAIPPVGYLEHLVGGARGKDGRTPHPAYGCQKTDAGKPFGDGRSDGYPWRVV